jgi:2-succinyl-5-enolpyruvyl-6-hydroxy-3-cyclohexene-1-carboxylate synthase
MNIPQHTFAYVGAFVDELVRSGVTRTVISPGSRSTPLAMIMAKHEKMNVYMHVDERSAAFFALGMAKATRHPVALVCTSGTAAANYLPAVVEGRYARVPLLVLTADRPHELREVGAPQTINQLDMYANFTKWFHEMAVPENTPSMLRYVRTTASRAAAVAGDAPRGPVHLNFPFREPLVPDIPEQIVWPGARDAQPSPGDQPYTRVSKGYRAVDPEYRQQLVSVLRNTDKGLIVCGPQDDPDFALAVTGVARKLGYPVLADPLSQVRTGTHDLSLVIDTYDAFLRDDFLIRSWEPDIILRFGAMPVSKSLLRYIQKHGRSRQIVVDEGAEWRDPALTAADMVYADPVAFCRAVQADLVNLSDLDGNGHTCMSGHRSEGVQDRGHSDASSTAGAEASSRRSGETVDQLGSRPDSDWCKAWLEVNELTRDVLAGHRLFTEPFEGRVFSEVQHIVPDGAALYVGNSMPVRDMDTFWRSDERRIRALGNRGANGIDGLVSSALGVSAVLDEPVVLVLGDLSFYHDLNGLLAAKRYGLNLTVIVINNDGGGIFSFLPQADQEDEN